MDTTAPLLLSHQPTKIAFVFSWEGSQHQAMGQALAHSHPAFQRQFAHYLKEIAPYSVGSQPYFVAFQMALGDFWRELGLAPDTCVGKCLGQIAASYHNGELRAKDALQLAIFREEATLPLRGQGGMLECHAPYDKIAQCVTQITGVSISIVKDPEHTIVSGMHAALEDFETLLQNKHIHYRRLNIDMPLHSAAMRPAEISLQHICNSLTDDAIDPAHWNMPLSRPLFFIETLNELIDNDYTHFVEIGPHPTLSAAMKRNLRHANVSGTVIASLAQGRPDADCLERAIAQLRAHSLLPAQPPITPEEDLIRTIWKLVLHRNTIGLDEDFFALGGTQHHAESVIKKLQHLEVALSLDTFLSNPTIRTQANIVKESCLITEN